LMVMAGLLSERTRLAACVGRSAYGRDENGAGHRVRWSPGPVRDTPRIVREWRADTRALDPAQSAEMLVNKW